MGEIWVLSPCRMEAKDYSGTALNDEIFFTYSLWNIKISKCPDISFLKITGLCQLNAFLCPSEQNHKTQSLGSPCSNLMRENWDKYNSIFIHSMLSNLPNCRIRGMSYQLTTKSRLKSIPNSHHLMSIYEVFFRIPKSFRDSNRVLSPVLGRSSSQPARSTPLNTGKIVTLKQPYIAA